ncbi:hypothetical protein FRC03_008809 [Tulasnella sp. 419]|nr:hypothetical protein FRC03_008809 [Tulasnella sp. 419]
MRKSGFASALLTILHASSFPYSSALTTLETNNVLYGRQNNLNWEPCWGDRDATNRPFTVTCAQMAVPLIHRDVPLESDQEVVILYIVKLSPNGGATSGTIFTTPGDPGGDGRSLLLGSVGWKMFNITQGQFDIITWDPRGVGESQPKTNCFNSTADSIPDPVNSPAWQFADRLGMLNSLECPSSGPSQSDIDSLYGRAPQVDAYFKSFVDNCRQKNGVHLEHVGTVYNVFDLLAIANKTVGDTAPINFWGFSYGTLLGQYFMSMYPNRMGQFVLDGSTRCKLAAMGNNADEIRQAVNGLLDRAYQPNVQPETFSKSSTKLRQWLQSAAGIPSAWPQAAEAISYFQQTLNTTSRRRSVNLQRRAPEMRGDSFEINIPGTYIATICGDLISNVNYNTTNEVMKEIVRITKEQSNVFGPDLSALFETYCHLWPIRSQERLKGQFSPEELKPAKPVLLIGTSASVGIPFSNAASLQRGLNSASRQAALIRHDGVGSNSFAMPSVCTQEIIRNYFINQVVPQDTICGVNFIGFPDRSNPSATAPSSIISAPLSSTTDLGGSKNGAGQLTIGSPFRLLLLIALGAITIPQIM